MFSWLIILGIIIKKINNVSRIKPTPVLGQCQILLTRSIMISYHTLSYNLFKYRPLKKINYNEVSKHENRP